MLRIQRVPYRPYPGRSDPRYCNFTRSASTNPIHQDFEAHLAYTSYQLDRLVFRINRGLEAAGDTYHKRPWFRKMVGGIEVISRKVRRQMTQEPDEASRNGVILLAAVLELMCSLVIYSLDPRFYRLTNEEIEGLCFPLSRWTRTVISRVRIHGDNVGIISYFCRDVTM